MSRAYDKAMEQEAYRHGAACVECGFYRSGTHHPKVRCPKTKRCGDCGSGWPCAEHAPLGDDG